MAALPNAYAPGPIALPKRVDGSGNFVIVLGACTLCGGDIILNGRSNNEYCEHHFWMVLGHQIQMRVQMDMQTSGSNHQGHPTTTGSSPSITPPNVASQARMGAQAAARQPLALPRSNPSSSNQPSIPRVQPVSNAVTSSRTLQNQPQTSTDSSNMKKSGVAAAVEFLLHPAWDSYVEVKIRGDDYAQLVCGTKRDQSVADLYDAVTAAYAPADPSEEQSKIDDYIKQQKKAAREVSGLLANPFYAKSAEARCVLAVDAVVTVHKYGIPTPVANDRKVKIQTGIKCSERMELLIQLARDNKLVAKDIIEGKNIHAMARSPDAYRRGKTNCRLSNHTKKLGVRQNGAGGAQGGKRKAQEADQEEDNEPPKKKRGRKPCNEVASALTTTADGLQPWTSQMSTFRAQQGFLDFGSEDDQQGAYGPPPPFNSHTGSNDMGSAGMSAYNSGPRQYNAYNSTAYSTHRNANASANASTGISNTIGSSPGTGYPHPHASQAYPTPAYTRSTTTPFSGTTPAPSARTGDTSQISSGAATPSLEPAHRNGGSRYEQFGRDPAGLSSETMQFGMAAHEMGNSLAGPNIQGMHDGFDPYQQTFTDSNAETTQYALTPDQQTGAHLAGLDAGVMEHNGAPHQQVANDLAASNAGMEQTGFAAQGYDDEQGGDGNWGYSGRLFDGLGGDPNSNSDDFAGFEFFDFDEHDSTSADKR